MPPNKWVHRHRPTGPKYQAAKSIDQGNQTVILVPPEIAHCGVPIAANRTGRVRHYSMVGKSDIQILEYLCIPNQISFPTHPSQLPTGIDWMFYLALCTAAYNNPSDGNLCIEFENMAAVLELAHFCGIRSTGGTLQSRIRQTLLDLSWTDVDPNKWRISPNQTINDALQNCPPPRNPGAGLVEVSPDLAKAFRIQVPPTQNLPGFWIRFGWVWWTGVANYWHIPLGLLKPVISNPTAWMLSIYLHVKEKSIRSMLHVPDYELGSLLEGGESFFSPRFRPAALGQKVARALSTLAEIGHPAATKATIIGRHPDNAWPGSGRPKASWSLRILK